MAKRLQDYPRPLQITVFSGLAVLVAGLAFWYWLLPLNQTCDSMAIQVAQLRSQNAAGRAFERQRLVYQRRIAEAGSRLQTLRAMVPDEPGTDRLVTLVLEAETVSGVHVRSFEAENAVAADEYVELPFKVRADGGYFALLSFFDRLGQAARITNVSDLALTVPASGGRGAYKLGAAETVAADFILSAYYNRPPGAPAPAKKK